MKHYKNIFSIPELFQHLLKVISSERFLSKKGLGKEVPFYICPFSPQEQIEITKMIKQLKSKLSHSSVNILEINLYDLIIDILKTEGDWDYYLEEETKTDKDEFKEDLEALLDVENVLIPKIVKIMKDNEFDVLFITGVGEVFPYIRSHYVLNNLQKVAKEKPTILFFPGDYIHNLETGASLDLFCKIHDDKYYRAFNILHTEA